MELLKGLLTRRSIRKYTGENVTREQIDTIIEAAMYAPSAVDKQPWHFIVFSDKKTIEGVIALNKNAWMLEQAAIGILVCYDETLHHGPGYGPVDCSAATQNLLLAAHGLGLGAVWVGVYPRQDRIEGIGRLFNLPENVKPFSIVSIGYPAEHKNQPQRFKKDRIHYENGKLSL
ncbi:MAG: nitroreductase family protein [Bacteroidales bacterium]|nr:nitroreductase family protein [Bacteroidales bacterium]